MVRWTIMPAFGSCQLMPLVSSGSSTTTGPIAISQPVGQGPKARNRADDVRTIQDALNQVTIKGAAGGAMPFLKVDGICGPKTNAAITRFQHAQFGKADGVIEPNKKGITRLNEIVSPISDEDLRAKVRTALPIVAQSIAAALANLEAAIADTFTPTGLADTAADRLNRHFKLNTLPASKQGDARIELFASYTRYAAVVSNPSAIDVDPLDEFDLDKQNPKIALTVGRGFFEEGAIDDATGKRVDRIQLGRGFFAPSVTSEFAAVIIVHELSHFVGHADGGFIRDFGRGWFDDIFIKPLPAEKRLANADSYATFAHECRVGTPLRPAFIKTAPGGLGGAR